MQAPAGPRNDEELVKRCRQGEPAAFEELYAMCADSLYGTAVRMLGRPEEAEELVQDAFVKLFTSRSGAAVKNAPAWLRRVTANACIDRLRERQRHGLRALDGPAQAPPRIDTVTGLDIERAVATLPQRAREVFVLHDVEGFRHREIAEMLGVQVGTSKSQLSRARDLLRAELRGGHR